MILLINWILKAKLNEIPQEVNLGGVASVTAEHDDNYFFFVEKKPKTTKKVQQQHGRNAELNFPFDAHQVFQ